MFHQRRKLGHVLTNLNAGDGGVNWVKFATDFGRGIHFEIVHILVRRGTAHVDHNDRFFGRANPGRLFRPQQLWQRQSTDAQCPQLERSPSSDEV